MFAYLLLYVDDIILTASSTALLQRIITLLHSEFAMTDLGSLNYFLGGICSTASVNPNKTPVDTEYKLGSDGDPVSDPTLYRSLAGATVRFLYIFHALIYLMLMQQNCPLHARSCDPHLLTGFESVFSAMSTSGYCVFLGDNLLSWSAKRQVTLSRSSAEVEYRGVANVVAETVWIRNLLLELHTPLSTATLVYCDNVHVLHVPSRFQYADIFTKGLPTALFLEFRSSLNVQRPPAQTVGEY
ncbi:ribonuclease H-like domain-containing protein [Tanacetum coccineum]